MIGLAAQYQQDPLFTAEQFLLENGRQLEQLHTYLKEALLPARRSLAPGRQFVLEGIVTSHQPQVLVFQEYANVAAWRESELQLNADPQLGARLAAWDKLGEPSVQRLVSLYASPHYQAMPAKREAKVFEWRVYQAPSMWQANGLHERFAGPEIPIFHRCGIHPAIYLSGLAGTQLPNLSYLTPFASLAEREQAWTKFQADPEWLEVKKQSMETYGFTPRFITTALYKPAAYQNELGN
ncbi:MAG: hypothetical protein OHK0021_03640 [Bryobacter sp.]